MTPTDLEADFVNIISDLFAGTLTRTASGFDVTLRRTPESYRVTTDELLEVSKVMEAMLLSEDTMVYNETSLEFPIVMEGFVAPFRRGEMIEKVDHDNSLTYHLGRPTNAYLLFFLRALARRSASSRESRNLVRRRLIRNWARPNDRYDTLFDLLLSHIPFLRTLRISAASPRTLDELLKFASGFVFQFSYNTSTPIIEIRFLDQFLRSAHMESIRRLKLDEIEPPRRTYIPDLVYHYQMALASDSPPLQFLSFFHVAEHFFEAVYNDDLINSVVATLTGPAFSYRRRHDVMALIRTIRTKTKATSERETYNEEEALRLVIRQHVDIAGLKSSLQALDSSLPEYYRTTAVNFAEARVFDIDEPDQDRVAKGIATRIYKTRNAIVHSKDGGKAKYVPFRHDRELLREIPLVRLVAEDVILKTSTPL